MNERSQPFFVATTPAARMGYAIGPGSTGASRTGTAGAAASARCLSSGADAREGLSSGADAREGAACASGAQAERRDEAARETARRRRRIGCSCGTGGPANVNGANLPSQVNGVNMVSMETRPHAPRRAHYHHGDLRHALLSAALKLVARKGVEGFSLREAARAVGVSAAAAYRHFEDKSALLASLAIEGHGRLATKMEEAIARAPAAPGTPARAVAELSAIGRAYVEFAVANPSHFRVMFGPWCEHPPPGELPPGVLPLGRDPFQLLVDTLDGMVRAGAIAPAAREGAEFAAWSAVHGLSSLLVEGTLPLDAAGRAQAYGVVRRNLLLGLGAAPALIGPPTAPPPIDPRAEKVRCRTGAAKKA